MAKCIHCGADTILHINGNPICVACDERKNNPEKPILKAKLPTPETQKTKKNVA